MSAQYKVNCKFLLPEHECSNVEVKKGTWGWSPRTLCKDWVEGRAVCRFREGHPKPNTSPRPQRPR